MITVDYVWLDGSEDMPQLRSKTRIFTQKYEGAVTGHYSQNIIAYDLGLKKENSVTVAPTIEIKTADGVDLDKLLGDG